ncbi:MAG: cytochrome c3 family protein [Acidobacteria bacterium]|nr:cytochrome c3 family protein [Acidobacteriota bacterium]
MHLILCITLLLFGQVSAPRIQRPAPDQPLPFSHKTHVAGGLDCKQCHPMPDPGDFATLPPASFCMSCHQAVKKESPHIARLAEFHNAARKIPWARVYRIPDYVFFNHKKHVSVDGVNCETCHGPVAERDVLRREKEVGMQACMDCHRARGASNDCLYCHEQR